MDNSGKFFNAVQEVSIPESCVICGEKHNFQNCDYIKISKHVPDNLIPPRARLTLPNFLKVQVLSDGSFLTTTKTVIVKGTRFGPFQAEKSKNLQSSSTFVLKIFSYEEKDHVDYFLDASDEEKCNWLMYVSPADCLEEQNLISYQESEEIYYVAIKDIAIGEALKVWYSPYYASKMNKSILTPKCDNEELLKNVDVDSLIKKQQKIMERKVWNCKFCSHIENNITSFARHILKHYTAQHKNMCELCEKTFGSKKGLKNHLKVAHKMFSPPKPIKTVETPKTDCKDTPLGGPLLNDMFTDSSDLNQFDLNLDNQNLLLDNDNLTVDNLLSENVKDLDHFNFEIDDSQKQFICDICLKQFTKVKLLISHLRHHTGDFLCIKCHKIFCRKENLKAHICNVSSYIKCTLCDRTFTQRKYLSRHLNSIHNKKYNCLSCGKCYYSNKELLEHNCAKVPIDDKDKFICPICDKCFYREVYLKKHLKTHAQRLKPTKRVGVTCEVCGLFMESKNSYYSHKKKHGEPIYVCEFCNKKFSRKDILRDHLLTHQKNVEVECNICQKKLKTPKVLKMHMQNHNSTKTFKCPFCDLAFKCRPNLNRHVRNRHNKDKKSANEFEFYNCPVCQKSIKLRSSVLRHLKKVHSDVKNIDLGCLKPKLFMNPNKNKQSGSTLMKNHNVNEGNKKVENGRLETELDDHINKLLDNAANNTSIQKHAVDSLVEELDIGSRKEQKEAREVCLSIPDLTENNYQEITLDKNAYILDNGTIVQPQGDSDKVIIYVLDQTY